MTHLHVRAHLLRFFRLSRTPFCARQYISAAIVSAAKDSFARQDTSVTIESVTKDSFARQNISAMVISVPENPNACQGAFAIAVSVSKSSFARPATDVSVPKDSLSL